MKSVYVDEEKCIGCMLCADLYPEIFEMKDGKSIVKDIIDPISGNTSSTGSNRVGTNFDEAILDAKQICPVGAIK